MTTSSAFEQDEDLVRFAAALDGQYALEREIGRGGMGVVYLARDLKLDRRVAIKTLPLHLAADPVVRERFLREARTAGKLSHQNIVPIHRADELHGRVFFVMGFVDGQSMAQRIRDRGRMDPRAVVAELRDVASALAYAHKAGVVHRDVKAENILIDGASGRALVTDFGIARLAEAAPLTSTGQVLGTVYYLSPEQVSGDPVDARSDIYSLGVVGYFALSGRFPFDAELASAVLIAHVTKAPPPLHTVAPHTPRALADLIDRCLAKDPANRFQSCAELGNALASIQPMVDAEFRDMEPTGRVAHQPLISDTEAQQILGRAADLQARTGIEPRPGPIAGRRDVDRDAARRDGFKPSDVRDAAVEAGISAKYVDHALEEHGL
ncbi:MAG TPA: serine/threonine-protein kinase, partial [Gemmatimonadaceae bacterium]